MIDRDQYGFIKPAPIPSRKQLEQKIKDLELENAHLKQNTLIQSSLIDMWEFTIKLLNLFHRTLHEMGVTQNTRGYFKVYGSMVRALTEKALGRLVALPRDIDLALINPTDVLHLRKHTGMQRSLLATIEQMLHNVSKKYLKAEMPMIVCQNNEYYLHSFHYIPKTPYCPQGRYILSFSKTTHHLERGVSILTPNIFKVQMISVLPENNDFAINGLYMDASGLHLQDYPTLDMFTLLDDILKRQARTSQKYSEMFTSCVQHSKEEIANLSAVATRRFSKIIASGYNIVGPNVLKYKPSTLTEEHDYIWVRCQCVSNSSTNQTLVLEKGKWTNAKTLVHLCNTRNIKDIRCATCHSSITGIGMDTVRAL